MSVTPSDGERNKIGQRRAIKEWKDVSEFYFLVPAVHTRSVYSSPTYVCERKLLRAKRVCFIQDHRRMSSPSRPASRSREATDRRFGLLLNAVWIPDESCCRIKHTVAEQTRTHADSIIQHRFQAPVANPFPHLQAIPSLSLICKTFAGAISGQVAPVLTLRPNTASPPFPYTLTAC